MQGISYIRIGSAGYIRIGSAGYRAWSWSWSVPGYFGSQVASSMSPHLNPELLNPRPGGSCFLATYVDPVLVQQGQVGEAAGAGEGGGHMPGKREGGLSHSDVLL